MANLWLSQSRSVPQFHSSEATGRNFLFFCDLWGIFVNQVTQFSVHPKKHGFQNLEFRSMFTMFIEHRREKPASINWANIQQHPTSRQQTSTKCNLRYLPRLNKSNSNTLSADSLRKASRFWNPSFW